MRNHTLTALALALALAGCRDGAPRIVAVPAAEVDRPGTMTVTGTATLEVSPDCADLTMTISADGARPGVAAVDVQRKQRELVAALLAIGIANPDIKLSYLTLNPVYARDTTLRIATYRAEITVTATTKHFDQIGAMMEAGANAGASAMSSQFRRSDLPALKKQVREMALHAAQDKAAQTAKALGIQVGRVISVQEAPAGSMWGSPYFPQVANEAIARPSGDALGGTLQPLTLDVTIGFELARGT